MKTFKRISYCLQIGIILVSALIPAGSAFAYDAGYPIGLKIEITNNTDELFWTPQINGEGSGHWEKSESTTNEANWLHPHQTVTHYIRSRHWPESRDQVGAFIEYKTPYPAGVPRFSIRATALICGIVTMDSITQASLPFVSQELNISTPTLEDGICDNSEGGGKYGKVSFTITKPPTAK